MPRTRECDYCGADIEPGTGTMYVRTDGTTTHYCSSKCESNASLGREARDLEWTKEEEVEAVEEPSASGETGARAETDVAAEADETATAETGESAEEGDEVDAPGENTGAEASDGDATDEADDEETEAEA